VTIFDMNRRLFFSLALLSLPGFVMAAEEKKDRPVKIVLVGDSTVAPRSGWGDAFIALLKPGVEGINRALGGRSSKSFRTEGAWDKALALKPTHILIQFGHNDQPGKGPARETDPKTTYPENLARFIDEARAIGAEPILVTSMVRRTFSSDNQHLNDTLAPYAEAALKVGQEKNVKVVDLRARSKEQVEKLGPEGSKVLDADAKEGPKGGGGDRTHLSKKGAEMTAPLVAEELKRVGSDLAGCLK
jgi:lysophospholipase L1-like esterase